MRRIWNHLDKYRHQTPNYKSQSGDRFGCFIIPRPSGTLRVIATDGDYKAAGLSSDYAWEHVSVSLVDRCPSWEEMDFVKDLFWSPDECVVQYHVPKKDHINRFPYCLHLWRPLEAQLPRPPAGAVG